MSENAQCLEIEISRKLCKICGQQANGNHFGIASCRACAAFFRRAANAKWATSKCRTRNCDRKITPCKPCRLKRCYEQGMSTNNFQFNRDILKRAVPHSMEIYTGKPEMVMFVDPSVISDKRTFINVQCLIDNASKILEAGPESPVFGKSQLLKLANGMSFIGRPMKVKYIQQMTKEDTAECWEYYISHTAKWLTYFDEFQKLDHHVKLLLVKSIWHTWGRLEKHALTAVFRKEKLFTDKNLIIVGRNAMINVEKFEYDHTWLTKYPQEQVEFFTGVKSLEFREVVDHLIELEPTHVELTYMLAQLSFEYAGKRYQGEILKVCERFQEILADDLHSYYVNERGVTRYSERVARMMKINNMIQKFIREIRPRADLARTFDIFSVDFSHPECFLDTGF